MASDPRAVRLALACCTVVAALGAAPARAAAAEPWWQPLAFSGQAVTSVVSGDAGSIEAVVEGRAMRSDDGGAHFTDSAAAVARPGATALAGDTLWQIRGGRVFRGTPPALDPASPDLGKAAHLIGAPASLPGGVICVSAGGTVWRRSPDGTWSRSLLLLPDTLVTGVPEITGIAAFSRPLSDAVYLSTRGYGTLLTSDGGDDWIRADSGLPGDVFSLAADSASDPPQVLAGTDRGLYVHRLRALPQIPAYAAESLLGRWLATVAVCIVSVVAGAAALLRLVPRPEEAAVSPP
jgi:hypothetical protein